MEIMRECIDYMRKELLKMMQLVKLKTIGGNGKNYYPIYLVAMYNVNGEDIYTATRIYTHEKDARGFQNLSLLSQYQSECANIGDYILYLKTGEEKYLHTALINDIDKKDKK